MVSPDSQATACLPSGRNSTYRPVQISGTGSDESDSHPPPYFTGIRKSSDIPNVWAIANAHALLEGGAIDDVVKLVLFDPNVGGTLFLAPAPSLPLLSKVLGL
jgi:hypothetical protein